MTLGSDLARRRFVAQPRPAVRPGNTEERSMTDQNDWQKDRVDGDDTSDRDTQGTGGLGDARPGAGSDWTPGASTSETSGASGLGGSSSSEGTGSGDGGSASGMGDASTGGMSGTNQGDWGNRSGSGSGGQGESDLDLGDTPSDR
jgi:hypothetical protein